MKRTAAYGIPVILGVLFCFYYLHLSADNVVYTDYIRLINSYLPDVMNPEKFFVPDILTRVPITYLARIINVKWFDYNTLFDMALGVISMGIGAAALAKYAGHEKKVSYIWFLFIMIVYYSLNKWEMLNNGTGWVCFLSISGFYYHYLVLDRSVRNGHSSKRDRGTLFVLPSFLILFVAGPYCGSYSVILILVYVVMIAADYMRGGKENRGGKREENRGETREVSRKINRLYAGYLTAVILPLGLYLWSNASAVYVHRGAVVGGSILGTFIEDPLFFVRLLFKGFAAAVLGMEQLVKLKNSGSYFGQDSVVCLLGFMVMCLYFYALYLTWRHEIYKTTILPLVLILNGGLNHLMIVAARWIFLDDTYGMSPRYMIQYQMGIIGILLTFAIVWKLFRKKEADRMMEQPAVKNCLPGLCVIGLSTAVILAGNIYTTQDELKTAPFRKSYLAISRDIALDYENASDEDLEAYLHSSPENVRRAMKILDDNDLNIFRNK